ncbi:branched-chain-amino-acid aminotransferase 2, chloroplastic-like isoform X2 [Mercurialis annua]|uniref:branched-chain-amino-acid aminotransferase 2, chloroplastic-like isoform X2 n=1 Tax=Mercurialis annua TaxID=3986 RepID=UPI00215DD7EF|nr:branched-chain-amino-acid aminotransferase 2, chloroplastic-like isoform X2 [Mercurialis annua]
MMIQRSARGLRSLMQTFRVNSFHSKLGAYFNYTTSPQQVFEQHAYSDDEYADIDWDNLGFSFVQTDYMYSMKCSKDERFEEGQLTRYGNIELSPSAGVLNYGQGVFEGTKAYRKEDGNILLFRPDQNAIRMKIGAERMCMPCPSIDQFVDAVKQTALANKRWVPPAGKDGLAPLNIYVEDEYDRASRGGVGGVKTVSNYAPVLKAMNRAKNRGFSDVLYLDSVHKKYLEEVSASNIFIVKGNVISTPTTNGTILPGITRKSIIEIAQDLGYEVEERLIPVDELANADEIFCTGTAVVVAPVGSITYRHKRMEYSTGAQTISWKLYSNLVGIQMGLIRDTKGWTVDVQ